MFRRVAANPEANLFVFGFLVNTPWEFLQGPLFLGMAEASHWEATKVCLAAALGDGAILVVAYWFASLAASPRSRLWLLRPTVSVVTAYLLVGFGLSVAIEALALAQGRWTYIHAMPVVPVLGVGLALVAQWLLLPPLALGITYRQVTAEPHQRMV